VTEKPLAFSLDLLAEAAKQTPPLTACPDGHLLIRGRSCWNPVRFSADLRALYCVPVEHGGEQ
jgi:hypothetical protein